MFPQYRLRRIAPAIILAAVAISATASPSVAHAKDAFSACDAEAGLAVLASPISPWTGMPLRIIFTAEKPLDGVLSLTSPDGKVAVTSKERHGGPPYFWYADVQSPSAGTWTASLTRDGASAECATVKRAFAVAKTAGAPPRATSKSVWPIRGAWTRETENLYSAWIEKLFDDPIDAQPSWPALHQVLRDPTRNMLFNAMGLGEDSKKLIMKPDCADLPYFLRAYFAFKTGLPFGYSKCTRGGGGKAPRCPQWFNIQKEDSPQAEAKQKPIQSASNSLFGVFDSASVSESAQRSSSRPQALLPGFGYYIRTVVANAVHSGSGRTAAADNNTDYYPVPLTAETLRPGTIYADPYGHVLVLVKRVAQTNDSAGVFLAVDGQPDGTVARKRFWRGNFLFAQDPSLGSPGFKRFRPIVADNNGTLRRLTNAEITKSPDYGDFSLEQSKLGVEDFYDRMDDVMSPEPLDPERAMKETITALEEQVKTRVTSVENGRKYQNSGGADVAIPSGPSIFETTGAWEDFATPSRDLRLLIAIDVVRGFPDRVARRADRYAMPKGESIADVKSALNQTLTTEIASRKFSYTRSDGSQWTLTLKDVLDRSKGLEMAYNVNDCVEIRWGADPKSDEASTCKRRASSAQQAKMEDYRSWFRDRRRPVRQ
ncbi:hypothetical protein [Hyphomicrobium sp. B1]|uniref:hypothetical protein n=1 Tax=Hyphomicrobium sp. B1 TaxID=3075651 RepID=UPI003C2CA323